MIDPQADYADLNAGELGSTPGPPTRIPMRPAGPVWTCGSGKPGTPAVGLKHDGMAVDVVLDGDSALRRPRSLNGGRTEHGLGLGLGLSIVGAIAAAHDARFTATARRDGGLEAAFPPSY